MNIFYVLSQGNARLHEPSMSAMLGYLLDSHKDHGLGDTFIRAFLAKVNDHKFDQILNSDFIKSEVELEAVYNLNNAKKSIDIEVRLLDKDNQSNLLGKIIIENKIRSGAAQEKQLTGYYNAILQEDPEIENLHIVFLTPESKNGLLKSEFDSLQNLPEEKGHYKKWLYWDSPRDSIVSMVKEVLEKEACGEINPINEHMRHTLKAFIRHSSAFSEDNSVKNFRVGEDIGEIVDDVMINMKDGQNYRVVRRNSGQIQVFNGETDEKTEAKSLLINYMNENGWGLESHKLNTRKIGSLFFERLKNVLVNNIFNYE